MEELLRALDAESPKFTPRFLGHMTSELALPALLGHAAVLLHNPNLTAKEVSVVTSGLEREAIGELISLVGMDAAAGRGHFTSGGTLANIEALWRALHRLDRTTALGLRLLADGILSPGEFLSARARSWDWFDQHARDPRPDSLAPYSFLDLGPHRFAEVYERLAGARFQPPLVLAPASRHFSWPKAVTLLGLGRDSLEEIPLDGHGRLSLPALEEALSRARAANRPVLMAVSVAGGTGTGAVDPAHAVQDILDRHRAATGENVWHHIDAAYGGYFCSLLSSELREALSCDVRLALAGIARADSVTLDPHKLGFVPYSCGAILVRDSQGYRCPEFGAPYLLAENGGAWQNTIEGSRAATGAVATWMACKTIRREGYARILHRDLLATNQLRQELERAGHEIALAGPADLNVLCFFLAREGESLSSCNLRTLECFQGFQASPNFSVSKTELTLGDYARQACFGLMKKKIVVDDEKIICLRVVLMNPFFSSRETAVRYEEIFVEELLKLVAPTIRG